MVARRVSGARARVRMLDRSDRVIQSARFAGATSGLCDTGGFQVQRDHHLWFGTGAHVNLGDGDCTTDQLGGGSVCVGIWPRRIDARFVVSVWRVFC